MGSVVTGLDAMTRVVHLAEPRDGGVPAVMAGIAIAQHQEGMQVTVVGHPSSDQRPRLIAAGLTYVDAKFTSLRHSLWNVREILRLSEEADLFHFHSSRAGLFRLLFLGRRRRPVIQFSPHAWGWLAIPRASVPVYVRVERLLAKATDRFHLLGAQEVHEARARLQLSESQYTVVPNGIDTALFAPREKPERRTHGGTLKLLCVGRLCRQKGQDLLIRAVAELPQQLRTHVALKLVGAGKDEQALRYLASELGVDVSFSGHQIELAHYYREADLVVLPSRWEGVPLVALEAIATGAAVLLTEPAADPQLRAWVHTCEASVEGLADALNILLADAAARERLQNLAKGARPSIDVTASLTRHVHLARALAKGSL